MRKLHTRHGMSRSRTYKIWMGLLNRCENPSNRSYASYGGRGVTVCHRWHEFENFFADMGEATPGLSIDRIDNDGPYAPENCRWATRTEQGRNKRNSRQITAFGETKTLAEWAEKCGLSIQTVHSRLAKGWPEEVAVSQPAITKRAGIPRGQRLFAREAA